MSNLLQLVNEVLRRTGQVETATLNNAQAPVVQARDFLNETYFEMLHRLKAQRLLKQGSFNTSAGVSAYSLAADAEINSLLGDSVMEAGSGQVLREVDYHYPLEQGSSLSGKPNCFYRAGELVHLFPVPDSSLTIQYQYLIKPETLSNDNDTTLLPVEWEKILILGTQARLERFLGESGDASYLLYRDGLTLLKSRAPLKPAYRMKGFYRGYS